MTPAGKELGQEGCDAHLAAWRARHGVAVDQPVVRSIAQVRPDVVTLENDVGKKLEIDKWNSIAGNVGCTRAGIRLFFAVEQAIAWIRDPIGR